MKVEMATATRPVEAQEQESNLKAAMLAKTAFRCYGDREPMLITAGDCGVFLTAIHRAETVVRFTVEEWEQIVEFVETQLLDQEPESWEPDWSKVPTGYNYVAADKSGLIYAYDRKPPLGGEFWGNCNFESWWLSNMELPAGIDWTETLRARPGVSL